MKNEPTEKEFVEMTEEARLRVIRALKVSTFWTFNNLSSVKGHNV